MLDTDLYKLTMMQVVLHRFPSAMVEYQFTCRNKGIDLRPFAKAIQEQVNHLCSLRFQKQELDYLRSLSFFKDDFVDFLRVFQLNKEFINIIECTDQLEIIIRGPWLHAILFEVPVLAIVGEVYYQQVHAEVDLTVGREKLQTKMELIRNAPDIGRFKFSEFGTRRRFSHAWQEEVLATLIKQVPAHLTGTSNVYFAKQFGIKPIGTMAHEYLQACQSLGPRVIYSQEFAF